MIATPAAAAPAQVLQGVPAPSQMPNSVPMSAPMSAPMLKLVQVPVRSPVPVPVSVLVVLQRCADDITSARALSRRLAGRLAQGFGAPLRLSRSATPGLAAVACARHGVPGVDVERLRPDLLDPALRRAALTPGEAALGGDGQDFFATWVRKEAVLKSLEIGLALPPASFAVTPTGPQWSLARHDGRRAVWVLDLAVPAGCSGAVAMAMDALGPEAAREPPPSLACRVVLLAPAQVR